MGNDKHKEHRPEPNKNPKSNRKGSGDFIGESKKDIDTIRKGAEIAPRPTKGDNKKK